MHAGINLHIQYSETSMSWLPRQTYQLSRVFCYFLVCVCVNVYVLTSVYIIPSIVRNVTLDIDGTIPDECHAK